MFAKIKVTSKIGVLKACPLVGHDYGEKLQRNNLHMYTTVSLKFSLHFYRMDFKQ